MITPNLAVLITDFFVSYLAAERNVSYHTTVAYRDTFKLLLRFTAATLCRSIDKLSIHDFAPDLILDFLHHLETIRGNSIRTCNARLACVHSFFRYILTRHPELAMLCQRVLSIRFRKREKKILGYLNQEELGHLLTQVDRSTLHGERDYLLLILLYDTGARIQEILNLKARHCHLQPPAFIRIFGKGRRERFCPLLPQTAQFLDQFFVKQQCEKNEDSYIFQNRYGTALSSHGARYIMQKYVARAMETMPSMRRLRISPHTLRHTKAMHLLQSGTPLVTIKEILGHADITSTEIYVKIDIDMKRKVLEHAGCPSQVDQEMQPLKPKLLAWLESL
jgi:site-specific recombinase XerD